MIGLTLYWIGISGISIWGLYRIAQIFHYEGHKYDKAYIQAKYHEGRLRCHNQVLFYTKIRSAHASKMNRIITFFKHINDRWHEVIAKLIARFQFWYASRFERQFLADISHIEKIAQSYQIYVGDQYHDFLEGP
jgi:hypothetical protein